MKIRIKSYWPGVIWFVLSTIAFCLPGSTLPKNDWFDIVQLDKWIHIGLFSVMVLLWCLPLFQKSPAPLRLARQFIWIALAFFCYGILMEFVQHFFIANRSFDVGDIAADAAGCFIGFVFVKRQQGILTKQK